MAAVADVPEARWEIAAGFHICRTDPTMRKIYMNSSQKESILITQPSLKNMALLT